MVFLSIPLNKWLIQGCISTVLAVLPLFLIRSYILHTFTKMVLLVIGLGALHGLVIIPAIMALLDNIGCQIMKQWRLFKDWKDWLWRLKKKDDQMIFYRIIFYTQSFYIDKWIHRLRSFFILGSSVNHNFLL